MKTILRYFGIIACAGLFVVGTVHAQQLNSVGPITGGNATQVNVTDELGKLNQLEGIDENKSDLGIPEVVGKILNRVLFVTGSIALIVFVYAGVRWMVAIGQGKGESAKASLKTIMWAVIGLAVIFLSYILVQFAIETLQSAATAPAATAQNTNSCDPELICPAGTPLSGSRAALTENCACQLPPVVPVTR